MARRRKLAGPLLDTGGMKWLKRTAAQQHWRVMHWIEIDDLVQEGMIIFARIHSKYPRASDCQRMALFKRSFFNYLNQQANRRTRRERHAVETPISQFSTTAQYNIEQRLVDELPVLLTLISDAHPTIGRLLRQLVKHGEALRAPYQRRADGSRETFNERLNDLLHLHAPQGISFWQQLEPRQLLRLHEALLRTLKS